LHTGTFTSDGTFDSIIPQIPYLLDVGFTALELMPVAQFAGERNWGYDGVCPFAAPNTYGGPDALKRLVNACHERGIAVILDVVYNHLGPEGNYLSSFAPYFTDRYKTPWGPALNFDDAHSDEVRHYFIQNALYWVTECHIDALRLDAVHAILDHSAVNFLEELVERVHQRGTDLNRRVYTIAESALNDTRLIRPTELGGYAIDAQWNDDFHHSLHTLLTKEHQGYYFDFGNFQHMAQAFSEGFVYSGRYSATRKRRHGNSSRSIPSHKFVVYAQNHDQIGNRMVGDRLSQLVSFEKFKLAEAITLLSPFIPLMFMGDEYGETAPFQYFVSHSEPGLVEAVRRGRKEEFSAFGWTEEPPDPQDVATFRRSKLDHVLREQSVHSVLLDFHKELIRLRKSLPALACLSKETMDVIALESEQTLIVRRWNTDNEVLTLFNFNEKPFELITRIPGNRWRKVLDSSDRRWGGKGGSVPEQLEVTGKTRIQLTTAMVLVFTRETED
jgi:maltooligosyltrehalose trehalohydrolase